MTASRLEALEKFLETDPGDSFTHYAIALEYASQKRFDDAIKKLEALIILEPEYVPAYQQLGYFYTQLHQHEEAKDAFRKGIEAAKLARDHHAQGEMQEALDELEEC